MTLHVGIIGGGTFGRAIAVASARNGHDTYLKSRSAHELPGEVNLTDDLTAFHDADLIFLAVPARHIPAVAKELSAFVDGQHLIVHVSRGLVGPELSPITTVIRHNTAARRLGALGGPLVAEALYEGRPSGAIIGTRFPQVEKSVRAAIGGTNMRLYHTNDVVGVQIASATVGMLSALLGYAQQAGTDPGTLAILATRGIVEATRIGETFGCSEATFNGLAGFGDLVAVVAGDDRPEIRLGRALATGLDLNTAKGEAGAFIEGVQTARDLVTHSNRQGVDTPIMSVFVSVMDGSVTPDKAIEQLMTRPTNGKH